ncbi:hypothetical protein SERLADRAFT_405871 [Serpula lacrymans var. lacrymans S7.9]|uniref:Uncharacterized protein n=1 Tax=Serpula lacrymans var. lacrymans (strain S7.9) TaxID=578457 RepID=F8NJN3_SERL9|nr:uncharacterized protein SERLADRAFT_405871 [Serpula lacrymans var. lacrymans S7.9]EGO28248.1 hypothetical protein SERLADRAFT_405871 [Serpula lacrymans var. lacrymans S7.9]
MPNAPKSGIAKMAHFHVEMAEAKHQLKEELKRVEEEVCTCANCKVANCWCKEERNTVTGPSKGKSRAPVELEALEIAEHQTKKKKVVVSATEKSKEGWQAQMVDLLGALLWEGQEEEEEEEEEVEMGTLQVLEVPESEGQGEE